MKRFIACCLTLLLLGSTALGAEEPLYDPYEASGWAQAGVARAIELGYHRFSTVGDRSPSVIRGELWESISRGKFASAAAAMVAEEYGSRLDSYLRITSCHRRVAGEMAYGVTAVDMAQELGILQGRGEGELDLQGEITRQEAAVMLARTLRSYRTAPEGTTEGLPFADAAEIADWAREDVALVYRLGVMNGVGEDRFDPLGTYTVEQCMVSLVRLHEQAPRDGSGPEDLFALERVPGGYAESWTDTTLAFAVETEDYWAMAWAGPAMMGGPKFHIEVIDGDLDLHSYSAVIYTGYSDFYGNADAWPRNVRVSEDGGSILYDAIVEQDVHKNGLADQPLLFQRGLYTVTMDLATGEQTWTRADLPEG